MAVKKPISIYNGLLKQIQSGDITTGESSATIAKSIAKAAESQGVLDNSIADRANSRASEATSIGERAQSLGRIGVSRSSQATSMASDGINRASQATSIALAAQLVGSEALSLARTADVSESASFALVADSVADIAIARASEATSMATRAASLARVAVESSDVSEAGSLALRAQSIGRFATSRASEATSMASIGIIRSSQATSIALAAESQGTLDNSLADHAESEAKRGLSIARRIEGRYTEHVEIRANEMSLDTIDLGSSRGSFLGIADCIDFAPGMTGTVWVNFALPRGILNKWLNDVSLRIHYSFNGSDADKIVTFNVSWWQLGENDAPNLASPDGSGTKNITTSSGNIGKFSEVVLMNLDSDILALPVYRIFAKISRSASDTYTGTAQVQSVVFREEEA